MISVLSINDNNLLLQLATTHDLVRSQGYAWLKDGQVFFDFDESNRAAAASRLVPQQINNRYWQQCEQTALRENESGMRHAADLVWSHLTQLQQQHQLEEIIFIVPAHYRASNLSLLLGIAQSCGLNVIGLVNKAAYAVAGLAVKGSSVLHIDVQLHQTVGTYTALIDEEWRVLNTDVINNVGLLAIQDALLKTAQEQFIQIDRFDPLHYAETEQQLFDQLTKLASMVRKDGTATASVEYAGREYSATIDAQRWRYALNGFVEQLMKMDSESNADVCLIDFNGFSAIELPNNRFIEVKQSEVDLKELSRGLLVDEEGKVVHQTSWHAGEHISKKRGDAQTQAVNQPDSNSSIALEDVASQENAQSVLNSSLSHATHILFKGRAVAVEVAHIEIDHGGVHLHSERPGNLEELMASGKLFIVGDTGRRDMRANDRLAFHLSDDVLSAITVVD